MLRILLLETHLEKDSQELTDLTYDRISNIGKPFTMPPFLNTNYIRQLITWPIVDERLLDRRRTSSPNSC